MPISPETLFNTDWSGLPHTIRPSEVARLLSVSEFTLSKWRRLNKGPQHFYFGPYKQVFYRREAVQSWVENMGIDHPGVGANRHGPKRSKKTATPSHLAFRKK